MNVVMAQSKHRTKGKHHAQPAPVRVRGLFTWIVCYEDFYLGGGGILDTLLAWRYPSYFCGWRGWTTRGA